MTETKPPIVFFDGECGLCHFAVQWVAKRDTAGNILFAPLQGETAKRLLPQNLPDTLVLYEEGKITYFGKGAAKMTSYLPYPWKIVSFFGYLPSFLIDPLYRIVARHRSTWFKPPSCALPTSIPPERFLP